MPFLSEHPRKQNRAKRRAPPPAMTTDGRGISMKVSGVAVTALPEGALWISEIRALVVSDLHLEKGSAYARRGQMLPPYDTRTTLTRIAELMDVLAPAMVVSLGDSFHDVGAPDRLHAEDWVSLRALTERTDWVWIEGNHDPAPPVGVGGRAAVELSIDTLTLRHEGIGAREGANGGELSGHLHPCAKVAARGSAVRRRCFATDGVRMVMPAFGAYTGGLNVRDEAFALLFPDGCYALVLGKERVYPAAPERLIPDV